MSNNNLHQPGSNSLEDILGIIMERIQPVLEFQMQFFRSTAHDGRQMKNSFETVSEVDIQSEQMLHEILMEIVPEATFYGEETIQERNDNGYVWIVDPIDGTTNFLKGIDLWSVSIALFKGNDPVAACIVRPAAHEVFTAAKGVGAYLNGKKIALAELGTLQGSVIGTGMPFRSPDSMSAFFACAPAVLQASHDIRRMGSAAIDLAYVGADFLQAFWEIDLMPYDVAAALLILKETGCKYSTINGNPYDPFSSRLFIAGRPGVFEELVPIVSEYYADLINTD